MAVTAGASATIANPPSPSPQLHHSRALIETKNAARRRHRFQDAAMPPPLSAVNSPPPLMASLRTPSSFFEQCHRWAISILADRRGEQRAGHRSWTGITKKTAKGSF
nr:hypothetical protein Itr_chr01CG09420 [Ipomoea trifida]GLL33119.1 hypothetical protein Itr_chr08CG07980 [Ipomoea trifida]